MISIELFVYRLHFLDIMTKVIRRVTDERGPQHQSMVPECKNTLRKDFYLPQMLTLTGGQSV